MSTGDAEGYLLANSQDEASERFGAFETLFDPWTFTHLDRVGVRSGARCWEIGAGNGSVARWLAQRVGPSGRVLATDIDVRAIPDGAPFEVRRHDVARDPAPGLFDVIHARLVLVHVPQRHAALESIVAALAPGGVLLLEDADPALQPLACPDEVGPAEVLANRIRREFRALLAERGADLAFGRTLPRLLRSAGLLDVTADAYFPVTGTACAALETATIRQIATRVLDSGRVTRDELDEHLGNVATRRLDAATAPLISAWGRRAGPAAGSTGTSAPRS